MTRFRRKSGLIAVLTVTVALHVGCVGAEEDVESTVSALEEFGPWTKIANALTNDAPALARVGTTPMMAFGLGVGENSGKIVISSQSSSGSWGKPTMIKNGGPFLERPTVVGFAVTSGPLVNHFAIIARRADTNGYYIRIQNRTGSSVIQDWTRISSGIYASGPAAAFVPPGSLTGPQATLVVIGLGLDNRLWQTTNTLLGNQTYSHAAWVGPNAPFPEQTFVSAPAIAYTCPRAAGVPSLVASSRTQWGSFLFASGSPTAWNGWTPMNGTFSSGPAIGVGCGASDTEISVYGRGLDDRIWTGVYTPGVPFAGFTPIGSTTFVGSPTATGFSDRVTIAANGVGGPPGSEGFVPFSSSAQSPSPPPMLPSEGLVLWVKGDVGLNSSGGLLTSWLDQAGQNQHIDQIPGGAAPSTDLDTINGIPCVTFPNGELGKYAYHAGALKDRNGNVLPQEHARTVMAVIKPKGGNAAAIGGAVFSMADNPNFECLFDVETAGTWYVFGNLWPFSGHERLAPPSSTAAWNGVPVLGEWRSSGFPAIAFAVNGGSDQPLTDIFNVPTTTQAGVTASAPGASFMIGNAWNTSAAPHARNFHGAIAEIMVWDYDLTTVPAARAAARAYIATRYPSIAIAALP